MTTEAAMQTRIVKLGNAQGVRIPKPLLEASGLEGLVELEVAGDTIVIRPVRGVRQGWAKASQALAREGNDVLLDEPTPTRFDEEEWTW